MSMLNTYVPRRELCRELLDLSNWDTEESWYLPEDEIDYSLGYLLRKLPAIVMATGNNGEGVIVDYGLGRDMIRAIDNTPEDALCKLAIELFKQGILKKEQS